MAGLSTAVGGLLAVLRRPDDSMLAFLLGTAIGVMFVLSVAEMWIHNAIQHGWGSVTIAVLCGALLYQLISPFLPNFESAAELSALGAEIDTGASIVGQDHGKTSAAAGKSSAKAILEAGGSGTTLPSYSQARLTTRHSGNMDSPIEQQHSRRIEINNGHPVADGTDDLRIQEDAAEPAKNRVSRRSAELLRLGVLMAVTMTLHNAPEGFAVAFSSFTSFGPIMAFAIAIHNIPEGYIISLPLYLSTGSRWKAISVAALSGLSEPAGALIALLLGRPLLTEERIHYVLAFVGGIMAAVCALELWPEGRKCMADDKLMYGILAGAVVMGWTLWIGT